MHANAGFESGDFYDGILTGEWNRMLHTHTTTHDA